MRGSGVKCSERKSFLGTIKAQKVKVVSQDQTPLSFKACHSCYQHHCVPLLWLWHMKHTKELCTLNSTWEYDWLPKTSVFWFNQFFSPVTLDRWMTRQHPLTLHLYSLWTFLTVHGKSTWQSAFTMTLSSAFPWNWHYKLHYKCSHLK